MATREISADGRLVGLIRRNQVAAFVILAYCLSWWATSRNGWRPDRPPEIKRKRPAARTRWPRCWPEMARPWVRDLAGGGFLAQQRNLVLVGGTGKAQVSNAVPGSMPRGSPGSSSAATR